MTTQGIPQILPAIMGSLHQERAQGELVLDQNDGCRRLYWNAGVLVYLQSDVAGEQFGNYLLRQGVLDYPTLQEILASGESGRLGDRVVQWRLMTLEERDFCLASLQEQILIHAMEHPVLRATWNPGAIDGHLSGDLQFPLNHRLFVWNTFRELRRVGDLCDLLYAESTWRWTSEPNLLDHLHDLPLDPKVAFALSFLGAEPIGYHTFMSITSLDEQAAAILLMSLWALGAITLTQGSKPRIQALLQPPSPPAPPPLPIAPPTPPRPLELVAPEPPPPPSPEPPKLKEFPTTLEVLLDDGPQVITPQLAELPHEEEEAASSIVKAKRLFQRAKNLLLQERTVEAVRLLEQSVQLNPDEESAFEPWLLLGKLRLSNPAWSTRAIDALQAASRIKPGVAEPWALMGELYQRKGFKANAHACFKRALDLDPSVPIAPDVDPRITELGHTDPAPGLLNRFKTFFK